MTTNSLSRALSKRNLGHIIIFPMTNILRPVICKKNIDVFNALNCANYNPVLKM